MEELFDLNWCVPERMPTLGADEAHTWCTSLDQPLSVYFELKTLLSSDEQVRVARFRNERARKQFVLGRGLLRKLIAAYLEEHPSEIQLVYGSNGKPMLFPQGKERLWFNVSHSGELLLLGFCRTAQIGLDVEQVRAVPEADAIAERFFTPAESAALRASDASKREMFFKIWTRKEAVLKCLGSGFTDDADIPFEGVICELAPAPGYIGALAISTHRLKLKSWRWSPEVNSSRVAVTPRRL
ncbi:MAG: 4'-phosphopantetheinyl transferase family protein [Limisphaerales bacterium]